MKKLISLLLVLLFVVSAAAPAALADGEDSLSTALSYIFPAEGYRDPQAALELLLPLAEAGDAQAQYYCGWIYDFELEENTETESEAYKWYVLAAQQDHVKANVGAALNSFSESFDDYMNRAFELGFWTMEKDELAFEWYSKAAELGDTHAMCMLGHMYRDGVYVAEDDNTAMDYFIEAAVNGNISAPYVVDMMKACNEGMEVYNQRKAEYLAATAG